MSYLVKNLFTQNTKMQHGGYILLLSVLVVAALSVSVATALLVFGIAQGRTALAVQHGIEARMLADACAEEALERLLLSSAYTGGESLSLGDESCTVNAVAGSGTTLRVVQTSATRGQATRRVEVMVAEVGPPMVITQWKEVSDFSE